MKKIALLTSGGDAPGMNAAIRAITRKAIHEDFSVYGIERGFEGIINNEIRTTKIPSYLEDKVKYAVGFEGNNKILLDVVESLLEIKNAIKQDTDLSSTVQVMLISISRKI